METHELSIPVHDLDAAGKEHRFVVRREWLEKALETPELSVGPGDGSLDVRVSKSGTDVVVTGHLKAAVELPCGRCLKPAHVAIDQPITALMVPASKMRGSKGSDDEYEFTAEEADVLPYEGDIVVLDDLVRDEILLEIPMIPLCSPDCPGISPAPDLAEPKGGAPAERAVDPRLAPLLGVKVSKPEPTEKSKKKE